ILHDVEEGRLQRRYDAPFQPDYNRDPPPRRDLIPRNAFLTSTSVIASRGCRNRCSFCYLATDGVHTPYAVRAPEDIARQIRADRQPMAVFVDNNLGASRGYLRRLCAALRPLDTIWTAAVTLDVTDDHSLVREMSLAGCAGVFIGFETLNDENLVSARKRSPRAEDYERRVRIFHDHGIQINGSFVVGFDGDRRDVFTTLAQWIDAARLECATFHILTPYPGTPLFRQMEEEGRLLHRNWALYDTTHVVFRPKHMAPEELLLGYEWLYRRLFSHPSIWARRPSAPSEWPAYFAGAYLYKHANWLWPFLIRHRLVHVAWRPLVELARRRHRSTRHRLLRAEPIMLRADMTPTFPSLGTRPAPSPERKCHRELHGPLLSASPSGPAGPSHPARRPAHRGTPPHIPSLPASAPRARGPW
ncbi:MAG: radical SAM protein, partial [Acidobacteria bacterium]